MKVSTLKRIVSFIIIILIGLLFLVRSYFHEIEDVYENIFNTIILFISFLIDSFMLFIVLLLLFDNMKKIKIWLITLTILKLMILIPLSIIIDPEFVLIIYSEVYFYKYMIMVPVSFCIACVRNKRNENKKDK